MQCFMLGQNQSTIAVGVLGPSQAEGLPSTMQAIVAKNLNQESQFKNFRNLKFNLKIFQNLVAKLRSMLEALMFVLLLTRPPLTTNIVGGIVEFCKPKLEVAFGLGKVTSF